MAKRDAPYTYIIAESTTRTATGQIVIRPMPGQAVPQALRVEGRKELSRDYPVGTRFRVKVKLTDREGERPYLYTSWQWPIEVVGGQSG
jgi:hypothetical protein